MTEADNWLRFVLPGCPYDPHVVSANVYGNPGRKSPRLPDAKNDAIIDEKCIKIKIRAILSDNKRENLKIPLLFDQQKKRRKKAATTNYERCH